jgi:PmbA protein
MLKSKEVLSRLAEKSIVIAKKYGATDVEVSLSNSISDTINFRNKKIEHSDRSEILSLGLTTYVGKKKSNVSTSNFDEKSLEKLIERCVDCSRISPEDKDTGLPSKKDLEDKSKDLDLYDETVLTNEFKKKFLKEMEDEMFLNSKVKNSNGSSFSENKSNFIFANSDGFCDGYKSSSFSVFCEALAEENGSMERDYEMSVKRFANKLGDPKKIGKAASDNACKRLHARKIDSGKMSIIFDKRVARSLLSVFGSAISGSSFARGTSFLKNSLGKKIFNGNINIIDDPLINQALGSQCFDSEGVKNQKISLVENGVLKELFLDTYNAKKLGMKTNGRCGGSTNFFIKNGDLDIKKLISEQKKAFFVRELIGRAGDITNGNYSVGASGTLIENGEEAYPVNEVTIAGNLSDMFQNLIIANDLEFKSSINSPTLFIDGMTVAGK